MLLTNSSTAKQEEEVKERGSCQTLINIPLRSMLIKAGVSPIINSQQARSGTSFNIAFTGTHKSATRDFDLLVYYHLTNHSRNRNDSTAHDEMT